MVLILATVPRARSGVKSVGEAGPRPEAAGCPAVGRSCFVPAKRRIDPVFGRAIRAEDGCIFSHVQIDVRMVVRRHDAHAMKGGDADLDASHSEFVEEQWFFVCSESLV